MHAFLIKINGTYAEDKHFLPGTTYLTLREQL